MARIVLSVTPDTMLYAKTHGAKYDALNRQWYVGDEVPPELLNLVPHQPNPAFEEIAPSCPVCQASMVKRTKRTTGAYFWGCSRYRPDGNGCSGHIDYEKWLSEQLKGKPGHVTDYLRKNDPPSPVRREESRQANAHIPGDDPRVFRWAQLTEIATRECGSAAQASRWMSTPKVALRGKTPLEAMKSQEGCDAVEVLLKQLNL